MLLSTAPRKWTQRAVGENRASHKCNAESCGQIAGEGRANVAADGVRASRVTWESSCKSPPQHRPILSRLWNA